MINWKVRLKNKLFLASLASQTALMAQGVLVGLSGLGLVHLDLQKVDESIKVGLGIVNTVLVYLSFIGIVADPTTEGTGDSNQALGYEEPKAKGE